MPHACMPVRIKKGSLAAPLRFSDHTTADIGLEGVLQRHLDATTRVWLRRAVVRPILRLDRGSNGNIVVAIQDRVECWVIEGVEQFGAELQALTFRELDVLDDTEVDVIRA